MKNACSQKTGMIHTRGVTLIELLVAIVVSSFVIIGLFRLLDAQAKSYQAQESITELQQNAQYTIRQFTEVIMGVGNYLPSKAPIITVVDSNTIRFMTNSTEGIERFTNAYASSTIIPLSDATPFSGADSIIWASVDTTINPLKLALSMDTSGGFLKGVKTTGTPNAIKLTSPIAVAIGDAMSPYKSFMYFLDGTNLCCNTSANVLAENIKSLNVSFYNALGTSTTVWSQMRYMRVVVTARSAKPDSRTNKYDEITLSGAAVLRNKI